VDLLYDQASIRKWYAEAGGKGTSVTDRLLRWYLDRHAGRLFAGSENAPAPVPRDVPVPAASTRALERAAAAFAQAQRPLVVIGSQALAQATNAGRLAAAVSQLGVPVYLSGMARGLLGRDHRLQMRHARRNALRDSDCVLLAGVPCDFRLDYGRHVRRSATLIAATATQGKHGSTARRRLRRSATRASSSSRWRRSWAIAPASSMAGALRERDQAREAEIDAQAANPGEHVNPVAFFSARWTARRAMRRCFVADGGDFVATSSYILRPRGPLAWLDPGAFGTLGVGAGFALGATLARPGGEVWLLWGDGASGYGLAEFDTFVRHGIAVIAVVGNDAAWAQIAREQVKMLHDDVGTVLAAAPITMLPGIRGRGHRGEAGGGGRRCVAACTPACRCRAGRCW